MAATRSGAPQKNSLRQLGAALFVGTTLEWYDYFVYGAAAALALNKLFFPTYDPTVGTILAFGTFASAWITRPLGAFIFGHLGDHIGRRRVLYLTLIGMGIATIGTGLLPTYEAIGVWAPVLLIVFRMVQGLSAGGEFSGVATMSIEHAPAELRGRYSSLAQMGIPAALIGANAVSLLAYHLPDEALYSYGWRIPFLVSGLIFPVAVYIRSKLHESPAFVEAQETDALVRRPLVDVVRGHWRTILALMFANGAMGASFYAYGTYAVSYATAQMNLSRTVALLSVLLAGLVHITCVGVVGWFSDTIGRMKIFVAALAFLVMAPFPVFALINTGVPELYVLAIAVALGVGHGCAWAVAAVFFTELFPPELRYSGSAISYQVSAALLVGPVTIVCEILVGAADGAPWYAAGFLSLICVAGLVGALLLHPAARKSAAAAKDFVPAQGASL
ncbi:MHS family MFS transporter [Streptomyces sp. NBC_01795]|uniref:MFS transporter n=1 Tax=unclassified Streptomyces TaxID=2593676 RepID=UPI002DD8A41D|nr:MULTISPECIES: MFS transporter [unclassified Streptomyces]WSA90596.1 MHS family MFS transporter [Streptomyces sp. NBC_01795]WSB74922.1 MHS family MFS transporter [Streptomyces sp. NBC_01775]WSS16797.1 MHS family MFS transporter [Streptomyces sp. NBC_01186]